MVKQFKNCWVKDKTHYFFSTGLLRAFGILLGIENIQDGIINMHLLQNIFECFVLKQLTRFSLNATMMYSFICPFTLPFIHRPLQEKMARKQDKWPQCLSTQQLALVISGMQGRMKDQPESF